MHGLRAGKRKRKETLLFNLLHCPPEFLPGSSPRACSWLKTRSGCWFPLYSSSLLPNPDFPPVAWPKVPSPPASPGTQTTLRMPPANSIRRLDKGAASVQEYMPCACPPACHLRASCLRTRQKQEHTPHLQAALGLSGGRFSGLIVGYGGLFNGVDRFLDLVS